MKKEQGKGEKGAKGNKLKGAGSMDPPNRGSIMGGLKQYRCHNKLSKQHLLIFSYCFYRQAFGSYLIHEQSLPSLISAPPP